MALPPRFGWPIVTTIFLLLLSFLNFATATPLPEIHVNNTLVKRTGGLEPHKITVEEYEAFLKAKWNTPTHYVFYTGNSAKQAKAFVKSNPSYVWYSKAFDAVKEDGSEDPNHPWYHFFNDKKIDYMDQAEHASMALAKLARGNVLIFGGLEYQTKGSTLLLHRV